MFTGIIEETGKIKRIDHGIRSSRLAVSAGKILEGTRVGDSINTDGVCLTVTDLATDSFMADVMPETMRRTAFHLLRTGHKVNLERSLRLSDRLGGHLVSGHIDGIGIIRRMQKEENAVRIHISAGKEILRYIVEKGSVAVNGISLTVADVDDRGFDVWIIPHTQSMTSLKEKKEGDLLNIECDLVAKYLEKLAGKDPMPGKISMEFLAENGFL